MFIRLLLITFLFIAFSYLPSYANMLEVNSLETLSVPVMSIGTPSPNKLVKVTPKEYQDTNVYHTVYLPKNWRPNGPKLPIIFEYTGNYFPKSGSTGEVKDAALGYGLSGGQFIWVSLPYIEKGHQKNALNWWGDTQATVDYAKQYVPSIIREFNADSNVVFLCGFSRGAIGVNYIGLHDDEIAKLWTAFITHDHFDGVKRWKNPWGAPLDKYRKEAKERLKRVNNRPYLVSQNTENSSTQNYLKETNIPLNNFTFSYINTAEVLGTFPNQYAKGAHNDVWLNLPSDYRKRTWQWINNVLAKK